MNTTPLDPHYRVILTDGKTPTTVYQYAPQLLETLKAVRRCIVEEKVGDYEQSIELIDAVIHQAKGGET